MFIVYNYVFIYVNNNQGQKKIIIKNYAICTKTF